MKPVAVARCSNSKVTILESLRCPICGAFHQYIYSNDGGRGQYLCKVCNNYFNSKEHFVKEPIFRCSYCGHRLDKIKERSCFFVRKCHNDNCSFYINNLKSLSKKDRDCFAMHPENSNTLSLIFTYHINCGLSVKKTLPFYMMFMDLKSLIRLFLTTAIWFLISLNLF